jgi:hypothetical protein
VGRMVLEWHRKNYNVPAKKGMHVMIGKKRGIITGASGPHIKVKIEGESISKPYHPTDITYYED